MKKTKYANYGDDVFIHETTIIKHPYLIEIGNHIAIDNGVTISTGMKMGDYIHIAPYVVVIGGNATTLTLEDFSFIASGTKIVMGSEDYTGKGLVGPTIPKEYRELIFKDVIFKRFSGCGVNCTIMPGVTLAEGSIIGAHSLVMKDTEPWTIYVGSPAKPIKIRDKGKILEYAKKLGYEYED